MRLPALRSRTTPPTLASGDIAALTGLHRSRISQLLHTQDGTPLPKPDGEGSTETRPRWKFETIARWCAATGRRLPPETASWLLPGPDGPHLRPADSRTLHLSPGDTRNVGRFAPQPVDVHVARYDTPGHDAPSLWIVTPLIPSETGSLLGWPRPWERGTPLAHLVQDLITDHHDHDPDDPDTHLGTLLLLPTTDRPTFTAPDTTARLLELYSSDSKPDPSRGDLHDRLRRLHRLDRHELQDLVTALGHRLPLWPPGCATADLVAAVHTDPASAPPGGQLPPTLASAWAFHQRCASIAATRSGALADSVRNLGAAWWSTSAHAWQSQLGSNRGELPADADPAIWQVPVQFSLPDAPRQQGDMFEGLEWLMEQSPSQRLAEDALAIFGDPSSVGTAVIDLAALPRQLRALLTGRITPYAERTSSLRAQRVLAELEGHPQAVARSALASWRLPAGPTWCATAEETSLFAFHVPRRTAAPYESVHTPAGHDSPVPKPPSGEQLVGRPLELVLVPTQTTESAPRTVGFVITDTDQVVMLPAIGSAATIAAAIEHVTWHEGKATLIPGMMPAQSDRLVAAVEALQTTGPALVPWNQLSLLADDHEPDRAHCHYCRKEDGPVLTTPPEHPSLPGQSG
ncbi:hypothetical protein [Kitasatospora sp. NBC_01300]|uniref:hypothetical protein n=1 Tax=Kitasatospora sp. NBC_01300 TaxID=2903574 RepID=UPI00352E1772|nr:hypothetical protein OG556_39930 [Kitasatospora sp. NBC_01300]